MLTRKRFLYKLYIILSITATHFLQIRWNKCTFFSYKEKNYHIFSLKQSDFFPFSEKSHPDEKGMSGWFFSVHVIIKKYRG